MAKMDQHKIFFQLTPNLIGFVSKKILPMKSWSRDYKVAAKLVQGSFQIWTCSRTISKTKLRVRQCFRWLDCQNYCWNRAIG